MMSRIENVTNELRKMESPSVVQESLNGSSGPSLEEHIEIMREKTETLRLEIIANNAKYEKTQQELAAVRDEWNTVRNRKMESEKRLQTLDKNVRG